MRSRAEGGSLERRMVNASQYFAMVNLMGGMASMLYSGSIGVVRNVLLILRTATFCAICRMWIMDFGAW